MSFYNLKYNNKYINFVYKFFFLHSIHYKSKIINSKITHQTHTKHTNRKLNCHGKDINCKHDYFMHSFFPCISFLICFLLQLESDQNSQQNSTTSSGGGGSGGTTPAITLAELSMMEDPSLQVNAAEMMRREKRLKARIQELVMTLEKLQRNSEMRHQQSAEFVADLKRANR